jgi:hypothetical protein
VTRFALITDAQSKNLDGRAGDDNERDVSWATDEGIAMGNQNSLKESGT